MEQTYTIQEAARATGVSIHTLRYYEEIGLIHPIERLENSHRRYTEADLGWIEFLLRLRATGMPIHTMQQYARLQRLGDDTLAERVAMLRAHKQETEERMRQLNEYLGVINYKIEFYEGELARRKEPSQASA